MELTENEKIIIEILRELKPFEKIEITKDQSGKANYFIVHRSQKIILDNKPKENIIK